MKDKHMKYILFIFAKHKDQEKFVKILAEEIIGITDSTDIKYYYGNESVIFTFDSKGSFVDINEFFQGILGESGIVYFLSPCEPDRMSYWIDGSIERHLFNPDKTNITVENTKEEQAEVQKLLFGEGFDNNENDVNFLEILIEEMSKEITNENDIDDIEQIKSKSKTNKKTLDQLLDKIIDEGYNSLSDSDLKSLNEYSKI